LQGLQPGEACQACQLFFQKTRGSKDGMHPLRLPQLLSSNDTENNEEDKDEEIDLAPKLSLRLMLRCWSANIRARHDLGGALIAHEQLWTPVCCCNLFCGLS